MAKEKDYTKIICVNKNAVPARNPKGSKGAEPEIQYQEMSLLQRAIHFRDFEIEMSWKRATYFTLFLSAIFIAYYTIKSGAELCVAQYISSYGLNNALLICKNTNTTTKFLSIILPALGTLISWVWYLVNRGSKQTYENWEHHIDCIENEYYKGTLYSEKIYKETPHFFKLFKSFPVSASKANNFVSLVITLVFVACFLMEICNVLNLDSVSCILFLFAILGIFGFFVLSVWLLTSGDYNDYKKVLKSKRQNNNTFHFYNRLTNAPCDYIYEKKSITKKQDQKKDK